MLDGITVLHTMDKASNLYIILGFIITVCGGVGVLVFCNMFKDLPEKSMRIPISISIAIFCVGMFIATNPPVNGVRYKCTIDESVSFVEVMDRYEIINIEGEIYTIEEKE